MSGLFEALSGAKGIRVAGESQKRIAEFNAKVAEQEGKAAKIRSEFESGQQATEAQKIKSAQIANIGAAGGLGSPVTVDIAKEQERESTLENLLIGFEGEVAKLRASNQAANLRLQGEAAKRAAKSRARQANIQFGIQLGTSLLTGFGGGSSAGAEPSFNSGFNLSRNF